MKRKSRRLEIVRVGNAVVRLYRRRRLMNGTRYESWLLADHTSGKRVLRSFADHQEALREAQRIARQLASGDAVAAGLSGKEAASLGRALQLLRECGEPLELAVARYVAAVRVLGNSELLAPAARFYLERHPSTMPEITTAAAAAEMIALRQKANASEAYLADLRSRTGRFTRTFQCHPASVTTADVQRYLDAIGGANTTRNAHRQVVWRLFDHCESHGYIPKGANPVDGVRPIAGKRENPIEVWTPQEMAKLLSVASREFLPFLAIGAFAGLRTSEILALDWRDVRLEERTIKVTHRKLRCAGTRLAPIPDNLAAWLAPLAKRSGPAWTGGHGWKDREHAIVTAQLETAQAAGLSWRHNGLRHSFCTYRVAATQNAPQTALEAGNSAQTIFAHYRALATEREGKAWFAIMPEQAGNVIQMRKVGNA